MKGIIGLVGEVVVCDAVWESRWEEGVQDGLWERDLGDFLRRVSELAYEMKMARSVDKQAGGGVKLAGPKSEIMKCRNTYNKHLTRCDLPS